MRVSTEPLHTTLVAVPPTKMVLDAPGIFMVSLEMVLRASVRVIASSEIASDGFLCNYIDKIWKEQHDMMYKPCDMLQPV